MSGDWSPSDATPAGPRAIEVIRPGTGIANSIPMRPALLIVDDEEPILFAMKEYFESAGFAVDCAAGAEAARQLLAERKHGALIADLRLTASGRSDGLELVAHARESSPETQIVLLTAYGSADIEREAKRLGVGAFLHKPQPLPQIARILRELLASNSRKRSGSPAQ